MRMLPFLTVLSTLGLAACVFDASVAKETPDGGASPDASVATGTDGGVSTPGSGTDAGAPGKDAGSLVGTPDPGPSKVGAVFASILPPTPGNPSGATYAYALFQDGAARATSCLGRDEGVCRVVTCPTGSTPAAPATPKQAGTVDVGGISVPWNPLRKEYVYTSQPGIAWSAGQTITLGAAGGDIGAFSGTLTFPETLSVTAPGYSPGISTPLPVSKAAGIPLAWATTASDVHITFSEYASGGAGQRSINVTCTVPGPSSSFTVPATALRDLSTVPTASGGPLRSMQVQTSTTKAITVDGYRVNLSANVGGAVWEPVVSP